MNKVILKMNDPECCFYCPLARKRVRDDRYVCSIGHQGEYSFVWVYEAIDMDSKTKPNWCPLKSAEDYK